MPSQRPNASWILESAKVKRELRKVKDRLSSHYSRATTGNPVHRALLERGYRAGFEEGVQMAQLLIQQQEERDNESKENR